MKLSEYKSTNPARRIIVYGPPKSGKTELVGGLAAHGFNLHWFDLEDGIKTLLRVESGAAKSLSNIDLIKIPDTQAYPIAYQTLDKVVRGGEQKICFTHGATNCFLCSKDPAAVYTTIDVAKFGEKDILVVDSVSQWISSTMNYITREAVKKSDDYKPDWDDWRKQGFLLDRCFSAIQAGRFNFIGISHEEQQKLEGGAVRLVPVGGTGNYSKTFAKYFDDIVYTDVVNGKYRAYSSVEEAPTAIIGSRTGKKVQEKGLIELFR